MTDLERDTTIPGEPLTSVARARFCERHGVPLRGDGSCPTCLHVARNRGWLEGLREPGREEALARDRANRARAHGAWEERRRAAGL